MVPQIRCKSVEPRKASHEGAVHSPTKPGVNSWQEKGTLRQTVCSSLEETSGVRYMLKSHSYLSFARISLVAASLLTSSRLFIRMTKSLMSWRTHWENTSSSQMSSDSRCRWVTAGCRHSENVCHEGSTSTLKS